MHTHIQRRLPRYGAAFLVTLGVSLGAMAQSPEPHYDVASIKPDKTGPENVSVRVHLNIFDAENVSLIDLLRMAYNLRPGMLSGEPKWAEDKRFDIQAKVLDADEATLKSLKREDRQRMLQELLADRFQLKIHSESKVMPVYDLVVVRTGATLVTVVEETKDEPFHGVAAGGISISNGVLNAHYFTIAQFIEPLSVLADRPVLDKTGLTGKYDFTLHWTRDDVPASDDNAAPTLFPALEQQLGLKLEPAKAPVQALVVDHVELPSEN